MKLAIKVVAGASREGVAGWLGDALKVRVRQVAQAGKANTAVRRVLAATLEVSRENVLILSGTSSPHKVIEILGLDENELRARLPARPPDN